MQKMQGSGWKSHVSYIAPCYSTGARRPEES